jgi:hypothetical protein
MQVGRHQRRWIRGEVTRAHHRADDRVVHREEHRRDEHDQKDVDREPPHR